MSKSRTRMRIAVVGSIIVGLSVAAPPFSNAELTGSVKSSSGKPLEGVAVSARADNKTYTTTVYSDQNGAYFFPPLDSGHYKVWAQAVGFEAGKTELEISSEKKVPQDFTLQTLPDFHRQLSGGEWLESLPNESPEDRRLKKIFNNTCLGCHPANWILQNRFDAAGWGKILNLMGNIDRAGLPVAFSAVQTSVIQAYREDLVGYLTRVRGPHPFPLNYKPYPRATGEAAQIVVTEYDLPPGDRPEDYKSFIWNRSSSDWSEGTPSQSGAVLAHDVAVDQEGIVWFSDDFGLERTIGRLDPQTGRVTGYKMVGEDGFAVWTERIAVDQKGNVWGVGGLKFDPKTEKFQRFPRPSPPAAFGNLSAVALSIGGVGEPAVDSKGNPWFTHSSPDGAYRLDPNTGEYHDYRAVTKEGSPYGITVDAQDNAWFAQIAVDRLGVVDGRTGEVSEVVLAPLEEQVSAKDREIGARAYCCPLTSGVGSLDRKGPRRLAADRKGDTVWVAEYWANRLAKIDIHTKKVTEYPLPHLYSNPYSVAVDKNHMVWVNLLNLDRVAKFNPFTEKFTEYPLPTLGTGTRHLAVDDRTAIPEVWLPYNRLAKIARIQFRAASGSP